MYLGLLCQSSARDLRNAATVCCLEQFWNLLQHACWDPEDRKALPWCGWNSIPTMVLVICHCAFLSAGHSCATIGSLSPKRKSWSMRLDEYAPLSSQEGDDLQMTWRFKQKVIYKLSRIMTIDQLSEVRSSTYFCSRMVAHIKKDVGCSKKHVSCEMSTMWRYLRCRRAIPAASEVELVIT